MKVSGTIRLIRPSTDDKFTIYMNEVDVVEQKLREHIVNNECLDTTLNISISESRFKTSSQLGYFHAEVLPKLLEAYIYNGERVNSPEAAKKLLKAHFCYYDEDLIYGDSFKTLKSFSKAKVREMRDIIDFAISICLDSGIEVETPEEYKSRFNLKNFTK